MLLDHRVLRTVILGSSLALGACSDDAEDGESSTATTSDPGDGDPGDGDPGDGDPGDGDPGDGDPGDGDPGDGDGDDCEPGDGVCGPCEAHPAIGQLCVRGEFIDGEEVLQADGPVRFQLFPAGCYSSACTIPTTSTCEVVDDSTSDILLAGTFCLATEGECSLPDCSGGGWSECDLASLPAGDYTVTIDDLELGFTVPMVLDMHCVGDPFQ